MSKKIKGIVLFLSVSLMMSIGSGSISALATTKNADNPIEIKDIDELEKLNEGEMPEVYLDENDDCKYIDGNFTNIKIKSDKDAVNSLKSIKEIMGIDDPSKEFALININTSSILTAYKLQQKYNNVSVYGREVVVTLDNEGNTLSVGGNYLSGINLNTKATLSSSQAKNIARGNYNSNAEINVDELTIYTLNDIQPTLCWKTTVNGSNEDGVYSLIAFIDANTGNILTEVSLLTKGGVQASGEDLQGNIREVNVYELSAQERRNPFRLKYEMFDTERNIKVYNANTFRLWSFLPGTIISSRNNTWRDKASVSAMVNLAEAYDYYKENFGRNSFDNNGAQITASVHFREYFFMGFDNAFWTSDFQQFVFGDGQYYFKPLSGGLDVVAHEYTHAVVDYTAGLIYSGESGALNEAYADIMGNFIENKDEPEWLIGEDVILESSGMNALRSMSNPESLEQPSVVGGEYYWDPSDSSYDNGGVHINSGIINHAAFLMWENGITDKDKLSKLFYNSLLILNSSANFEDCRIAVITAAKGMKMSEKELEIINNAFDEVGVRINKL